MTNHSAPRPLDNRALSGSDDGSDQGSLAYLVLICFVATLGGLLFGYDTAVIAGAIGFLKQHFDLSATQGAGPRPVRWPAVLWGRCGRHDE